MKKFLLNLDRIMVYFIVSGILLVGLIFNYFESLQQVNDNRTLLIEFYLKSVAILNCCHLVYILSKKDGNQNISKILEKYKFELQILVVGSALSFLFDILDIFLKFYKPL